MDREHRIRQRAYRMWEDEGRPEGRDREHWDRAARAVDGSGDEASDGAPPTIGQRKSKVETQSSEPSSGATAASIPGSKRSGGSRAGGSAKRNPGGSARR
jgi:hypothetical protein